MNATDEPWEIARDMTRKQYKTLAAIQNNGGEARTSEITAATDDLYGQLVNQHYKKMTPAGLIEKVDEGQDTDRPGLPRDGHCYRITERGQQVLSAAQEDYGIDPLEEGVVRRRFDKIEDRLDAIEQTLQKDVKTNRSASDDVASEERVTEIEEQLHELESFVEDLTHDVQRLADELGDLEDAL